MRRPNLGRIVLAGLLLTLLTAPLAAQSPADAELKAKLDEAVKQLAGYDFGSPAGPATAIRELVVATHDRPAVRRELAGRLAELLVSGAPRGAKDFACRQLSIIGTAEQVPALAALLTDENLSHMARYALERIPGPQADEALRGALGKAKGKLLVGVINTLGNRQDAGSVGELAKLLGDADPAVASAAAVALGKLGSAGSDALIQALTTAPAAVRPAVADACLRSADATLAQGKAGAAAALYARLRQADVSKASRVAATRGAILAAGPGGVPILLEQLRSDDPALFGLGLQLVRQIPGAEVTKAVSGELVTLPAAKQLPLLVALADRGCKAAEPDVLKLASAGDAAVRAAAIRALASLGDAALVPMLFEAALAGEGEIGQAARSTLATLPGKDVDAAVVALLAGNDANLRRTALEVVGQRRIAAAPLLLKAAADPEVTIRTAALKALGETGGASDLAAVADLLVAAKTPGEINEAKAAVVAICSRIGDKDACAAPAVARLARAAPAVRAALIQALGQIGGAKALEALRAAVKDADETVRDTAVRVLADWSDLSAAPDLAALAKDSESAKLKILALRGYLRLAGRREVPAATKLSMCQEALSLAQRDDERKLVLGVLGGVPTAESLALAVPFLDNPATKEEAATAAYQIGEKIATAKPAEVAAAMKKVIEVTGNQGLKPKAAELLGRIEKK